MRGRKTGEGTRLRQRVLLLQPEIPQLPFGHHHGGTVAHGPLREQLLDGDRASQVTVCTQVGDAESPFSQDATQRKLAVLQVGARGQVAGWSRGRRSTDDARFSTVGAWTVADGTDVAAHEITVGDCCSGDHRRAAQIGDAEAVFS